MVRVGCGYMRTEMRLAALAAALEKNCGDLFEACREAGCSVAFVTQWRKDDPQANERLTEAQRIGYMRIESVAIQRAIHGHEEDVYYQGDVVGQKVVHHDGLLQKIMAAKLPEYSKGEGGGVNVQVNVANIMPRAASYNEWLEMKSATLEKREELPALPSPDNDDIIEAEFVPVPTNNPFAGVAL